MTVVEWHPDDLLDKQRAGALDEAEQKRLDDHLARCAACRIEALAIEDFAHELEEEGDDDWHASGSLSQLVRVAVAQREPERRRPRWLAPAVAAALVVLAAGSAAALYAKRPEMRASPALETIAETMQREAVRWSNTSVDRSSKGHAAEKQPPDSATAPTAAELFAAANQARRRGERAQALHLYRELARRYPNSPEAELSNATVGRMLLDGDDPEAALEAFDRYLGRGRGVLGEEALLGRALALQKLGRKPEERAAWEALLRAYPSSVHAARARARLAALGGG